jgi:hypothetical protein
VWQDRRKERRGRRRKNEKKNYECGEESATKGQKVEDLLLDTTLRVIGK